MSILGVRKKSSNILNNKIDSIINRNRVLYKDNIEIKARISGIIRITRSLHKTLNDLNIKVLNSENAIKGIKDKKIINISYQFNNASVSVTPVFNYDFVFQFSGKIISYSILCNKEYSVPLETKNSSTGGETFFSILINKKEVDISISTKKDEDFVIKHFTDKTITFKKGDIGTFRVDPFSKCFVVTNSLIVELDI